MSGFKVVFTGFKTLKQAQCFADWYEGQGEQDCDVWMSINVPDGIANMNTDMDKYHKVNKKVTDTIEVPLEMNEAEEE